MPLLLISEVVRDYLDPQDARAFGIHLQGQASAVDLEHRQIIRRSLGHDLQAGFSARPFPGVGTMLVSEDRPNRLEIQLRPRAIDQSLKHGVQIPAAPEQEVPAVLDLIDRVGVLPMGLLLLSYIQGQAEALGQPMPQDLLQAPYRAVL